MRFDDINVRKPKFNDEKNVPRLRICVLGSPQVGKTAVVVRFLTKRFIGEYCSGTDLLYKKQVVIDDYPSQLEIVDTSNSPGEYSFPVVHAGWSDACIVVFSIASEASFETAAHILASIQKLKEPLYLPVLLLANQKDLEHLRQVRVEDGQALALQNNSHFVEISAAENVERVHLTLMAFFREVRTLKSQRTAIRQRRPSSSLMNVSKLISSLIGRGNNNSNNGTDTDGDKKARHSIVYGLDDAKPCHKTSDEAKKDSINTSDHKEFRTGKRLKKRPSFSL